jgi:regulator of nucleoside diphosphate kinase
MAQRSIRLTTSDRHRLFVLVSAAHRRGALDRARALDLVGEIREAEVVAPTEAPPDLITMRTTFRLTDLDSGEDGVYTLVYPDEEDPSEGKLSVLAPLGAAVLGQRVGATVEPLVPDAVRRGRLDEILFQPEAAGCYEL